MNFRAQPIFDFALENQKIKFLYKQILVSLNIGLTPSRVAHRGMPEIKKSGSPRSCSGDGSQDQYEKKRIPHV
jgi:hypothetical protein